MTISLLGVPYDLGSTFRRGAAGGPGAIRAALHSDSTNTWNEEGADVLPLIADRGDVALEGQAEPLAAIERAAAEPAASGRVIFLGGDHAITWPLVRAVGRIAGKLTILHLDAHPDLYDRFDERHDSHASPFARIMEEGLASRLVQLGIRTMNGPQRAQAERHKVEVVAMREGVDRQLAAVRSLTGPVYLSLDLDVLDPAFAPGVGHPEPGGLTTRELITLIQAVPRGLLAAADIVELNPSVDRDGFTARVAAKCLKEIVGRMG